MWIFTSKWIFTLGTFCHKSVKLVKISLELLFAHKSLTTCTWYFVTVQRLGVLFGGHQSSSSLILAVLINNKTTTPSGFDEIYELVEFVNIYISRIIWKKIRERIVFYNYFIFQNNDKVFINHFGSIALLNKTFRY